jgi:tRNA nucleotidyltransferase/poly(A) polymerase
MLKKILQKKDLPKEGLEIALLLSASGHEAYLVGGTVRDAVLGRPTDNIDIATSAVPKETEAALKKALIKSKPVGKKFGTVLALTKGIPVEITTFRKEGEYKDRRHPYKVSFIKDAKIDSQRRDFTINSLYLDPKSMQISDWHNGLSDLSNGIIKFVGKPADRIDEDSLRMLRAARFAVELGFKIEKKSFAAIKTRAKYTIGISGERVRHELDKILSSRFRKEGLTLLDKLGLVQFLIPELELAKRVYHNSRYYHLEGNVYNHVLLGLPNFNKDELDLIYAWIFHDLGKMESKSRKKNKERAIFAFPGHAKYSQEVFKKFADRIKMPRTDYKLISWLILRHDDKFNFREMDLNEKLMFVRHPNFEKLAKLWHIDSQANLRRNGKDKIRPGFSQTALDAVKMKQKLNFLSPLINKFANGKIIMSICGIKPGPKVKNLIDKVVEQVYLGNIRTYSDLKKFLS